MRGQQQQGAPYRPSAAELQQLRDATAELKKTVAALPQTGDGLRDDVEIYAKAADWILRHPEEFYTKDYFDNTRDVLNAGMERAIQVRKGFGLWRFEKGRVVRAYRSVVDGSVQPYVIHVPQNYDGTPMRLDIWLHGRAATMNEVSFITGPKKPRPETSKPYLVLEVFGRTNNAYRWAGEADVFEALASVRERYRVIPFQVVLRGFSMGGAGAWHLGLHHPSAWSAMEAGAGFNETRNYAKLQDPPPYIASLLHIYDAYEYALNAANLPVVAYGGELDPQLQASRNVHEQLKKENLVAEDLRALFIVGPKTEHRWHPESQKMSDAFIESHIQRPQARNRIRFVTYTTRYNTCDWLTVDGLEKHYERAEVDARRTGEVTTRNVSRLTLTGIKEAVIDGQKVSGSGSFEKRDGKWRSAGKADGLRKRNGLQGPIDDAFMGPFLVVNPPDKFRREWDKWFRGDLPERQTISKEEMATHNVVLFGDPSTSELMARIAPRLPVKWVKDQIVVGTQKFAAGEHTLALIYPNPLAPGRYVVFNSGHTFGEREFRGTNALLYPRLGDYAVIRKADGQVVLSGMFDENWKLRP